MGHSLPARPGPLLRDVRYCLATYVLREPPLSSRVRQSYLFTVLLTQTLGQKVAKSFALEVSEQIKKQ
jgi:hypothetical protein